MIMTNAVFLALFLQSVYLVKLDVYDTTKVNLEMKVAPGFYMVEQNKIVAGMIYAKEFDYVFTLACVGNLLVSATFDSLFEGSAIYYITAINVIESMVIYFNTLYPAAVGRPDYKYPFIFKARIITIEF